MIALRRLFLALGGFLAAASLLGAVPPRLELEPSDPSLAGQVLIASPAIGDPRFRRTVILLVTHSKNGALGIVINRPLGEQSIAGLLELFGEKDRSAEGTVRIFAGGPVQPEICFVIHTADSNWPETIPINGVVAVTSNKEVVRGIGRHSGPRKTLVAFGYAGWGPGQLEGELARNDWATAGADLDLIFDVTREQVWDEAMARRP